MNKALIVLGGASFRFGGQTTLISGIPESYQGQIDACNTHIKFAELLKNKFNIDTEFLIYTYSTCYNNDLINIYSKYKTYVHIQDDLIGYSGIIKNCVNFINTELNVDTYTFVHFIRIDLYLKDMFFEIFKLSSYLKFSSICWTKWSVLFYDNKHYPRVADLMLYIPSCYFNIIKNNILELNHDSYVHFIKNNLEINDIGFYLDTYNDSDSAKDFNPLYYIVNRPQTTVWHSADMKIDSIYIKN